MMAKRYFMWRNPMCEGRNPEWQEVSGNEFYRLIRKPENRGRRFIRLGNNLCPEDDVIYIEATPAEYADWHRSATSEAYRSKLLRESGYAFVSIYESADNGKEKILDALKDPKADVESEALSNIERAQLAVALMALDKDDLALLSEIYLNGKTMAEVARKEGVNRSSIKRRVDSIIKSLRKHF